LSRGNVSARLLSDSEAGPLLAAPVFLVLTGVAEPVFASSTRAAPSPSVLILRTKPDLYGIGAGLPVAVLERQWHLAVVPVLKDQRWNPDNPLMASLIATGPGAVISLLSRAISQSFRDAGWGPPTG